MKTSLDTYPPPSSLPQAPALARTNQFVHERYRAQNQGVSISLTTQEGDQITLRQSASSEQMRAQYKNAEGLSKIEASVASANMSLSVEGDLNAQELTDLSKLLNDLSGIADSFFKGNLNEAMSGALSIGDMGSISKLEATFTRSSVLASYMETPHPIPSFAGQQNDPLLDRFHDDHAKSKWPSMVDAMTAQWRQFLASLTEQDEPLSQPTSSPASATLVGKQMLERAKETMNAHARLTPLIPSVADLAIDQALQHYGQNRHNASRTAQEISTAFTNELNNWIL